ncbi:hypothetical protein [Pseudomonas gorinensis]
MPQLSYLLNLYLRVISTSLHGPLLASAPMTTIVIYTHHSTRDRGTTGSWMR